MNGRGGHSAAVLSRTPHRVCFGVSATPSVSYPSDSKCAPTSCKALLLHELAVLGFQSLAHFDQRDAWLDETLCVSAHLPARKTQLTATHHDDNKNRHFRHGAVSSLHREAGMTGTDNYTILGRHRGNTRHRQRTQPSGRGGGNPRSAPTILETHLPMRFCGHAQLVVAEATARRRDGARVSGA